MTVFKLRDYQAAAVDNTISWVKYKDRPAIVVIPTGGGKTPVIGSLIKHYYEQKKRVLMMTHREELLEQCSEILTRIDVPFTYYSAGLGKKELSSVTVAGIQSISNVNEPLEYDVVIIDECHRLSNNDEIGQYWDVIKRIDKAKLIGLTATPFRMEGGELGWGDVVYEIGYPELLKMGYLSPIINKLKHTPDLSSVKVSMGDYQIGTINSIMMDDKMLIESVRNIKAYSQDPIAPRKKVIIFCCLVDHCYAVQRVMQENGMQAKVVDGETSKEQRKRIVDDFKNGDLQYLINCAVFLEGFDAPNIDMIVCLRPTKSIGLWHQLLGRGCRLAQNKENCLLIDMSGNLKEHGGLGFPYREKAKKEKKQESGKICPNCEEYVERLAKECGECGYVFIKDEPRKAGHGYDADTQSETIFNPLEIYDVHDVEYVRHKGKNGKPDSIKIKYICDYGKYGNIAEWLSPHSASEWAQYRVYQLMKNRGVDFDKPPYPDYTIDDIIFRMKDMIKPLKIVVDFNKEFPTVVDTIMPPKKVNVKEVLGDDDIPF